MSDKKILFAQLLSLVQTGKKAEVKEAFDIAHKNEFDLWGHLVPWKRIFEIYNGWGEDVGVITKLFAKKKLKIVKGLSSMGVSLYDELLTNPHYFEHIENLRLEEVTDVSEILKAIELLPNLKEWEVPTTIQKVDLSNQELTELPHWLCHLTGLRSLILNNNQLTTLPESFGRLKNLDNLYLANNQLTSLPESFGNLKKLQWLGLSDNRITSLPESFGNLKKLVELYLDNNQLTTLPTSFKELKKLKELYLGDNPLEEYEDSFCGLTNLLTLDLTNTQITKIPYLGDSKKLDGLHLKNNQIETIGTALDFLIGKTGWTEVNIANNPLTSFPKSLHDNIAIYLDVKRSDYAIEE